MAKRNKFEILRDILEIVSSSREILHTPLMRKSNISSKRFKLYYSELLQKKLIREIISNRGKKKIVLTEHGQNYLEKYQIIIHFIDEFEL